MTWNEALEIMIARTRHERYRWLCSDANPDEFSRERYRAHVIAEAQNIPLVPSNPSSYPPLLKQAATVVKAAAGFALDGFQRVDEQEHDRRLSICQVCEHFDAEQDRCRRCGCYLAVKPWFQRESCPDGKW